MRVAMYLRLSSEDGDLKDTGKAESESISNQRGMLKNFISGQLDFSGWEVSEFCDDGWSEKNFERPDFLRMMEQVRQSQIQCIVCKDLSRFGRDYLVVGNYISRVFPFLGVRFIAVNDGFDSSRPQDIDSLDTSFKTLIYDLYSRELSVKVKNAKRMRAEKGLFLSPFAPYGYLVRDPSCTQEYVWADEVEEAVVEDLFRFSAEKTLEPEAETRKSVRELLEKQREKEERKLRRLYSLYSEGEDETLREAVRDQQKELASLWERIAMEETRQTLSRRKKKALEKIQSQRDVWPAMTLMERRAVVDQVIERVTVTGHALSIAYKAF